MKKSSSPLIGVAAVFAAGLLLLTSPQSVRAATYLSNGDFEAGDHTDAGTDTSSRTYYTSWYEVDALDAPAAIAGDHSPEIKKSTNSYLSYTALNDPDHKLSRWVVEMDVAMSDPSHNDKYTSFSLALEQSGDGEISVRTDPQGDLQVMQGHSDPDHVYDWHKVLKNALTFSSSETSLKVNHIKFIGDYSGPTPQYSVTVTDADGNTQTASGLTYFFNGSPAQGARIDRMNFTASQVSDGNWFIVDNVSVDVPEPGSLSLLGLGGLALLSRKRRRIKS